MDDDLNYNGRLEPNRRTCTWLARKCAASWANRGWLTFEASTDLKSMNKDLNGLRALVAKVFSRQIGFETFDRDKFGVAWKSSIGKTDQRVQALYDTAWAGLTP